jgi:predicted kinase
MVKVPALMIILGSPASGKTTLARQLAVDLHVPCLCKDDIKEALFETLGTGEREWSRRLSEASFGAMAALAGVQIAAGLCCIVEGNWRAAHPADLFARVNRHGARTAQVCCRAEPEEIARRFTARQRHAGHLDGVLGDELRQAGESAPTFMELPGPRWVYASDSPAAYPGLLQGLKSWGL